MLREESAERDPPPSRRRSATGRAPRRFQRRPRQGAPSRGKTTDKTHNRRRAAPPGQVIAACRSRNPKRSSNKSEKRSWRNRRWIGRHSPPPARRPGWPTPARRINDRTNSVAWAPTKKSTVRKRTAWRRVYSSRALEQVRHGKFLGMAPPIKRQAATPFGVVTAFGQKRAGSVQHDFIDVAGLAADIHRTAKLLVLAAGAKPAGRSRGELTRGLKIELHFPLGRS